MTTATSTHEFLGSAKLAMLCGFPRWHRGTGGHGGTAWSLPFAEAAEAGMMQPQDGAVDTRTRLAKH